MKLLFEVFWEVMNLIFVTNMLNHHQYALCEAFKRHFDDFRLVTTEKTQGIGYQTAKDADFVLHYENSENKKNIEKLICDADVVIFGACSNALIEMRIKQNKLSFLYSERFFKKGVWRRFIPSTRKAIENRIVQYKDKNIYVLCASAYLPYDLKLLGFPVEKCFKWGYFPATNKYDVETLINNKSGGKIKLLWVGRMLGLKHPDDAVKLAKELKKSGIDFELSLVGDGALTESLKSTVKNNGLSDCVHLLGSKSTEEVRSYMEEASIFLFTSDRNEGWGAVLNEAMNSGCAVVASHAIGSVPFLINDGKNGLIYRSGDIEDLYEKVKYLIDNKEKTAELGKNAYITLACLWNAETAAERFKQLVQVINAGGADDLFNDGPCSKAEVLKDDWRLL